jgi:hypothetical protein
MFDERSEDAAVDVRNGEVAINNQAGCGHEVFQTIS